MNLLFGFSGRIGRGGWWLGQLAILGVIGACIGLLMAVGAMRGGPQGDPANFIENGGASMIAILIAAVALMVWINIATTVKRFHDRNKSGAWFCIVFVPYIGAIWQIVECGMLAGTPGMNDYGPTPGPGGSSLADGFLDMDDFKRSERVQALPASTQRVTAAAPAASTSPRRPAQGGFGRRGV